MQKNKKKGIISFVLQPVVVVVCETLGGGRHNKQHEGL